MDDNFKKSEYYSVFEEELNEYTDESKKIEQLYDEAHEVFMKSISKGGIIMGGSADRDAIEMSKSLSGIRQNRINVIKEKANVKKTIAELNIKSKMNEIGDAMDTDDVKEFAKKLLQDASIKNNIIQNNTPEKLEVMDLESMRDTVDFSNTDKDMVDAYVNKSNYEVVDGIRKKKSE